MPESRIDRRFMTHRPGMLGQAIKAKPMTSECASMIVAEGAVALVADHVPDARHVSAAFVADGMPGSQARFPLGEASVVVMHDSFYHNPVFSRHVAIIDDPLVPFSIEAQHQEPVTHFTYAAAVLPFEFGHTLSVKDALHGLGKCHGQRWHVGRARHCPAPFHPVYVNYNGPGEDCQAWT